MISIQLMGGLGNQLFQIFATIAYSIQHSHRFIFPYSEMLVIGVPRPTYWNNFLSNMTVFTTKNVAWKYANASLNALPIMSEDGFHYTEIPAIPSSQPISLKGYYQSYKYFQNYQDKIYAMLLLTNQQNATRVKYANYLARTPEVGTTESVQDLSGDGLSSKDIEGVQTISMHFRLGDYKEKQHFHPIMPKEYYQKALLRILTTKYKDKSNDSENLLYKDDVSSQENSRTHILVPNSDVLLNIRVLYFCEKEDNNYVSNVIEYIKNTVEVEGLNMREHNSDGSPEMGYRRSIIEFIKVEDNMEDWQQLLLMSCCTHNIIANSTFSWWGAYFNENVDKCVCYPSRWFGPSMGSVHTDDLFPPSWDKIEL